MHHARRAGAADLVALLRRRALASGVVVGARVLAGLAVVAADAPDLFADLLGPALPLVLLTLAHNAVVARLAVADVPDEGTTRAPVHLRSN
ncbi:hypothetical protein [Micromonospora sp. NPDC005707]|uniref:hypothetical protein n=1 Tax=Micromonospora sp. NPDC005707 TaxID=3157050 RepID=UPI0033ED22B6